MGGCLLFCSTLLTACADKPPVEDATVHVSYPAARFTPRPWPVYEGGADAIDAAIYLKGKVKPAFESNADKLNDCRASLAGAGMIAPEAPK